MTLSTAATRGGNVSVVSSWKLDTSQTTMPSPGKSSACAASGVPMLPATSTGRGSWARSAPVSAVVVVLPFVPVMAMVSASSARHASSISPMMGIPTARAGASCGDSSGTPGLTTTSSAPATPTPAPSPAASRTPRRGSARASRSATRAAWRRWRNAGACGMEQPRRRCRCARAPRRTPAGPRDVLGMPDLSPPPPRPPPRRPSRDLASAASMW